MSTNGVHIASQTDSDLDVLYAWMPPPHPAPAPLPEAALSLTLKGLVQGHEAMLTIRGQSPEEFQRNLAAVRGLLDAVPQNNGTAQPAPSQPHGQGWCAKHSVQMGQTTKEGRSWWSHKTEQGWCKGK